MSVPHGVYVHVPFCRSRCDYCAFATWTDRSHLMEGYVEACRREIAAAVAGGMPAATSVFFGGGTPTALPADMLCAILGDIPRAPGAETTVECNPEDAGTGRFELYRQAGVTRVSFGVQSTVPSVLASLGRRHGPANVAPAVSWARDAGFESFNLDLIYGAAGESDADWARTLDEVLRLDPPHVSAYALTVEPGTPLAADPRRHPDDDVQARRYEMAEAALDGAGLRWYEVSNWARPGHECRHNQLYWSRGDYRGFGCAAHSHCDGRRWWNVRKPERYIAAISAGRSPVAGSEVLGVVEREEESAWLALRTRSGVPAGRVPQAIAREGLVERRGDRAVLSVRGRLLANEVAARLLPARGSSNIAVPSARQDEHLPGEDQVRV